MSRSRKINSKVSNKMAESSGLKKLHRNKILKALNALPKSRGTCHEIAKLARMHDVKVFRRMSELDKESYVTPSAVLGKSPSGRPCTIWELCKNPKVDAQLKLFADEDKNKLTKK